MNAERAHPSPQGDAAEAASYWDARLRSPECSAADRAEYKAWRSASPENEEAFERLQDVIGALRSESSRPILRAMRDAAVRKRQRRFLAWGGGLAAAAVLALAFFPSLSGTPTNAPDASVHAPIAVHSYVTGIGEQRSFQLEDGSTVTLNTASRLETRFAPHGRRDVTLVAGQALFQVAHDASRPFVVAAGDRQVTAIGTQFDVRLDRDRVRVVLVEGRVAVERRPTETFSLFAQSDRRELVAGQEYDSSERPAQLVQVADVNQETMWREGRVSFEDTPLTQAVAEMNRYSTGSLIVTDPSMAELHVNGVFRTNENRAFVNALEEYFPIEAREQPGGDTLLVWRQR